METGVQAQPLGFPDPLTCRGQEFPSHQEITFINTGTQKH